MVAKGGQSIADSPKVQVGEIDTSAPFQSVKDAVTLFGEGALSGEKPAIKKANPLSAERVMAKVTQLHLAKKELKKLIDRLDNAEITRYQALMEVEKAKRTVDDLNSRLKAVKESKDAAIKVTEAAKNLAKQIEEANSGNLPGSDGARKQDLEMTTEQYMTVFTELDSAKQELRKIRQDCSATSEAKVAAIKQAAEAEEAAKVNLERVSELSKEISSLQESIGKVRDAYVEAQQEQAKILAEKDVERQSYINMMSEAANKLFAKNHESDPEYIRIVQQKLAEKCDQIKALKKQMETAKASDLDSVRTVTSELDDAKESLQKVAEEKISLSQLANSLRRQLENMKIEYSELKEKEAETESTAGNLHVKLRKSKSELEACLGEESKLRSATGEMMRTLGQLTLDTETAKNEAEEMKEKARELNGEAKTTRVALEEAEKKLRVALEEAEEAKAAESRALDEIKSLSERTNAARISTSEYSAQVTVSREEFEALSRKVEESVRLADMKVAAAMAQVEAVKASENEALKKLEATQKEIEDMKTAAEEALKKAEMANAAKKAVEAELRRWHERERKKAAEVAARVQAEMEMRTEPSPPHHYQIQKPNLPEKLFDSRKLEKEKPKKALMPSLSDIFQKKKNLVKSGSLSLLPGEKPV
ncbi:WEB family protein At5g55860-like [Carica papaya]|uniref:WEB family protein At5g55860-like n=1 Tax=Carica papaya TaxID=3649 RepID=UPI000B8C728F|nr:WEB family protein At5g55860-like [Carica papaya]XP_021906095.1 WEB family protein At5g55860-like [Carica papaya]XP_021906096.1 WEB family protein At5g55860-like [Carica papaya]XP_021906097.1 WEB family protein At5g55860-like [Carica papaya]